MHNCGYRTGSFYDEQRVSWSGDGQRPIAWSAWYPTDSTSSEADRKKGNKQFFLQSDVAFNAELSNQQARWPVVLMSHGTGGSAESLGWLASGLARNGFIVLAVNHHGNTSLEPYRAEAFLCWWERAADLTLALDRQLYDGPFAGRIDHTQASAIGFSIGGYTSLILAGARTSFQRFLDWGKDEQALGTGVREFPNLLDHLSQLLNTSRPFQMSWERQGEDFRDPRVKAVAAIAPAPPVRGFLPESVAAIDIPVTLIASGADEIAPVEECAEWLKEQNPSFKLHSIGDNVGHYTFLGQPSRMARNISPEIFADNPGVERESVHSQTVKLVLNAIS